jgi:hypothetical protein
MAVNVSALEQVSLPSKYTRILAYNGVNEYGNLRCKVSYTKVIQDRMITMLIWDGCGLESPWHTS